MSSPPISDEEPGDTLLWSRVTARLRFEEGATSSSESSVSSVGGALKPGVPKTVPFQILGFAAGLLPAGGCECCPPEVVLRFRAEADLDGGVAAGSFIKKSVGKVGVVLEGFT